jgi:signal transduction histidine kinase
MAMLTAADESARMASLLAYDILDTPREQRFDDIVQIAAEICGTPIAIINLVDADRQWGKAMVGVDDSEAPRDASFCARTIEWHDEVMVVPDTHEDSRFAANPQVTGDPHLRFYAGARIVDREGYALGSVCVADRIPRDDLTDAQKSALAALGRQAMAQMELRVALAAEHDQVLRLQELDRLRDQFISVVSHELRSPLTSIRGWVEVLAEDGDDLDPAQREALGRVGRNTDRLTRLVSDLLDLTRVDAGDLNMEAGDVDLSELTRDALAGVACGDSAARLTVTTSIADGVAVRGDASRLAQVVDNLCSNAVKYTPAGGSVNVSLTAAEGLSVLRVADSGIGIPPEEREHLFQRFFRASTATDRGIKGTGLGLAISKAIVERHGGTIAAEDAVGGGTAFAVTLPLAAERR